jgi:hypothetical protein
MPNWCNNSVTITHTDPAKITALADAFAEGRFCTAVIPTPECLTRDGVTTSGGANAAEYERIRAENKAETGYESWYDFCVARWGTKWDVGGADATMDIENDGCTLSVSFESAWAPPCGVYEELLAQGYDVVAHYWESGGCFVGRWHNGDDLCYDYCGLKSDTVRGYIGADLDDFWCVSESMAEWEAEDEPMEELTEWIRDGADKRGLVIT